MSEWWGPEDTRLTIMWATASTLTILTAMALRTAIQALWSVTP